RDHLTEPEQLLHQRTRVGVDLVGEVGEGGTTGQPDRLALATRRARAHGRRGEVVELLAPLLLRLAAAGGSPAGPAERASGAATTAATATTAGGWATPVATGRARAHTRGAGTAAVAATVTRAAAPAAAPTGRRARRGAATTAGPTARAGRPLAG